MATSIQRLTMLISVLMLVLVIASSTIGWNAISTPDEVIVNENVYIENYVDFVSEFDNASVDSSQYDPDDTYGDTNRMGEFSTSSFFNGAGIIMGQLTGLGESPNDVLEEWIGKLFRRVFFVIFTIILGIEVYFIIVNKKNS